jgi:hypothetical protein
VYDAGLNVPFELVYEPKGIGWLWLMWVGQLGACTGLDRRLLRWKEGGNQERAAVAMESNTK